MKLIAICGGSSSGKSTVSRMLIQQLPNSYHIDCDLLMFKYTDECQKEIFDNLGLVKDPNTIDREYFFSKYDNAKIWIKTISPYMVSDIENQINQLRNEYDYVLLDWAYLPLCSLFEKCDIKIIISSEEATRIERIYNRFGEDNSPEKYDSTQWKKEVLLNRIKFNQQISEEGKYDYYIDNNSDITNLTNEVNNIVNIILNN